MSSAELVLSVDVPYDPVEQSVIDSYIWQLFSSVARFVIIYFTSMDRAWVPDQVRRRGFAHRVEQNKPEWYVRSFTDSADPGNLSLPIFTFLRCRKRCDPNRQQRALYPMSYGQCSADSSMPLPSIKRWPSNAAVTFLRHSRHNGWPRLARSMDRLLRTDTVTYVTFASRIWHPPSNNIAGKLVTAHTFPCFLWQNETDNGQSERLTLADMPLREFARGHF
jgi:hypothetical protein